MYRFSSIQDYDRRLDQLSEEIRRLKKRDDDLQRIIDCEQLKLSYIIEKEEFMEEFLDVYCS